MQMHSTCVWVPRGHLSNYPKGIAEDDIDDKSASNKPAKRVLTGDYITDKYNMADYDNEGNDDDFRREFSDDYDKNMAEDDDESSLEELLVADSDSILLTGVFNTVESEFGLNVMIMEKSLDNSFVHDDVMLPQIPITTEYLDFIGSPLQGAQNIVAVSCIGDQLELWDLDCTDHVDPLVSFSGDIITTNGERNEVSFDETKSIMSVGWNSLQKNILATGSSDHKIRFWDLATSKLEMTLNHLTGKAQVCSWCPTNIGMLATGCFSEDENKASITVLDAMNKTTVGSYFVENDMNDFKWNNDGVIFLTTFENGTVELRDVRKLANPVWSFSAHTKACTTVSIYTNGVFATGGEDGYLRTWDGKSNMPFVLEQKKLNGDVLCSAYCPDTSSLIAVGGEFGLKFLRTAN
ncbi:WD-repeat protein, putative [Entamoeba invadens IP1]|uniref:WD-repeat protein, putative n=1 Tax=Entamoeba invadens IP1 TaxID=370355 RepID=A0A0A1UDP1_ENTIV|nr:WD-repeat protein, putative [Entamoeba invadens IP1]ELP90864.1 WD-repeat protein, putative [Entamoeba invadens IP1]|eukprot:XP_004257635.1 WD-repeat protein, putative [Entamoeba invadens IP1]